MDSQVRAHQGDGKELDVWTRYLLGVSEPLITTASQAGRAGLEPGLSWGLSPWTRSQCSGPGIRPQICRGWRWEPRLPAMESVPQRDTGFQYLAGADMGAEGCRPGGLRPCYLPHRGSWGRGGCPSFLQSLKDHPLWGPPGSPSEEGPTRAAPGITRR